jgi:hypothetical protein
MRILGYVLALIGLGLDIFGAMKGNLRIDVIGTIILVIGGIIVFLGRKKKK